MLVVAIGVQVYLIHEDPLDLGLVGLAEFLPLLILALPAGQIADRFSRRTVVAVGLVFQIVIATILVLITLSGADQLWPFLTVGALAGTASALTNPAGRALTPEIVPTELLPGAIALRSVANQTRDRRRPGDRRRDLQVRAGRRLHHRGGAVPRSPSSPSSASSRCARPHRPWS